MLKKNLLAFSFLVAVTMLYALPLQAEEGRITENWNSDWTFARVVYQGERKEAVNTMKPGDARIPEKTEETKTVRLPHDWGISGPFDEKGRYGDQGKLPWHGAGWYFKTFTPTEAERTYILDFDGCMAFPEVYVNDVYVGGWDYGYVGFQLNITKYLKFGEKNTVAVRCDTRRHGSRWYAGAGIYRNVRLIKCSKDAWLAPGSVFVTTTHINLNVAASLGPIHNANFVAVKVDVKPEILGLEATEAEKLTASVEFFSPTGESLVKVDDYRGEELVLANVALWSPESPTLYRAKVSLFSGDNLLDAVEYPFGIRKIEWTAEDGFHLNGRRYQLYGVNLHHDQGILGSASHPVAVRRQLQIMKDMGVNAIRTSHNPNSATFMDACDELGFIVWNELFDKWESTADLLDQEKFDEFTERQVRQLVHRDRNRPSVCTWSIGNEIADIESNRKGSSNPYLDAPRRVKHVADCFRKYDPTRTVAIGCYVPESCVPGNTSRDAVDVIGWNYAAKYRLPHETYPQKTMVYSESASAVSTRGYYELPHPKRKDNYNSETFQIDGYDFCSVPWGDIPDVEFERMEKDTYVAGEFVWTGFDYFGEPSPFNQDARSSYFGIVDLCGMPKDRFFLYRSYWNRRDTTVHLLPHWNWTPGMNVPVYVYTDGDEAELFLNGRSLGKKRKLKEVQTVDEMLSAPRPKWYDGVKFTASSEETHNGNSVENAFDGNVNTRWCATSKTPGEWLQIDRGTTARSEKPLRSMVLKFENVPSNYAFRIEKSQDGTTWETICREEYNAQLGDIFQLPLNGEAGCARFYRIIFENQKGEFWASVVEWQLSTEELKNALPSYYAVVDKYRLRWEDVTFEPGTLEVVAYKAGKEIGRETVRTAGDVAGLRLTPETTEFRGDDDLCYVLVEAVDKDGNVCPNAMTRFDVTVEGDAELVGIGNGNPMGYDVITDASHPLFYGKAMIVLRSQPGTNPKVTLNVSSQGIRGTEVILNK